jgi:thiamine-monophosphate kinase
VTGRFGGPAAKKFEIRDLRLEIRVKEAQLIAKAALATAMIDSSDGLVRSIMEICKASKVGARIWLNAVPRDKPASLDQSLYGGEEYELVFTVKKSRLAYLQKIFDGKTKVSLIGEVVDKKRGIKLVDQKGREMKPRSGGYEHFK